MHEFSLAYNIVEIVQESVKKAEAKEVSLIHLEIGSISGVEVDALLTALESLTHDTQLENAKIEIDHVKAEAKCLNCKSSFQPKDLFELCPNCESYKFDILRGKEFKVKSIEIST